VLRRSGPGGRGWPPAPHPRLRGLLPRGYAGFTEVTTSRHLVLPATTSVPLVVKLLDSPYRPAAFVVGAHDSALLVEAAYAPSYLEVLLAPLGAYRLLGLPVDKLSGQIVDLVDVFGPAGRRLAEQLRQAPNWRRFALLDRFLLGRLERGPQPSPEVGWAWARLVATHGAVPIGRLASEVGWSHMHLLARFRQQVGLRPKTAARLVRLDGVWRRLDQARGRLDWGQVAREAGNADQAHLIRDFHQFTGATPTEFAAWPLPPAGDGDKEVNSVQDAPAAAP
jgi:AraC-like DNA-binding protein